MATKLATKIEIFQGQLWLLQISGVLNLEKQRNWKVLVPDQLVTSMVRINILTNFNVLPITGRDMFGGVGLLILRYNSS